MSLMASSISGAAYVMASGEDKDIGNGFEFTRRKRWPQLLLQELVGSALFCLKPLPEAPTTAASSDGKNAQLWGWKIIFASPSIAEMIGQRPADVEGRDFFDLVYAADQAQLQGLFQNLLTPNFSHRPSSASTATNSTMPNTPTMIPLSTSSKSQTTYIRMITDNQARQNSGMGSFPNGNTHGPRTVIWEVRAHATGTEGSDVPPGFGLGGAGTMVPQNNENGMQGKAIWVMGRRVSDGSAEGDGNPQSLDAFLELKLENEKLRSELRDLRGDMDDDEPTSRTSFVDQPPSRPYYPASDSQASSPSSSTSSPASSPAFTAPTRPKVGRPPKEKDARDKKKSKKGSVSAAPRAGNGAAEGEGMHVCVTCGRTDSPEWRKGPLGPKTLCNACGLRWAKRNSTAPARKDKRAKA